MLINEIRDRIRESVLHNTQDKDVLRVVVGEAQTIANRNKAKITDEMIEKIIRQMVASNIETIETAQEKSRPGREAADTFWAQRLLAENEILKKYLPTLLTPAEIMAKLLANPGVVDNIFNAKSDGSATGMAMKEMQEKGLKVSGTDVVAVIKRIRNPGTTPPPLPEQ